MYDPKDTKAELIAEYLSDYLTVSRNEGDTVAWLEAALDRYAEARIAEAVEAEKARQIKDK